MIYIKKTILACYTRVSVRRLSSRRKKSTCGVLPLKSPDLKPIETLWIQVLFGIKSKTSQQAGACKLYKEVLEEEGHAGEACKIHRSSFAKGCSSYGGGSRCWNEILQKALLRATASCSTKLSVRHCIMGRSKWLFQEPPNLMTVKDQYDLCIAKNFLQYWYS